MALREYVKVNDNLRDSNDRPTQLLLDYWKVRSMSFGSERRKMILEILKTGFSFAINCKHCLILKKDPDLKRLLKQGKIKLVNNMDSYGTIKRTYIRLKD